ncbi:MAG: hydrogenase maturation nickel metallochaperone HypA [Bacteroidales bacterium]|nr:MAG: hydrogenase maturation nickel metallochaperone HypA [Bacteroidales bacterium]
MHELSVAMSIVDIADEYASNASATVVNEIEIEVGQLSGVIMDALKFAMDVATKDTILENASCKYIRIDGLSRCRDCTYEFETDNLFTPCPKCQSYRQEIIRGKELRIRSLTVE